MKFSKLIGPVAAAIIIVAFAVGVGLLTEQAQAQLPARQTSRWTTNTTNTSASGGQATISQPAVAGTKHVLDCVGFSASASAAPLLNQISINIRDGATGAGTVRHSWTVVIPATTGQSVPAFHQCGLNVVGSTNTAMTVEFSVGVANVIEAVNMGGFDTQPNQ